MEKENKYRPGQVAPVLWFYFLHYKASFYSGSFYFADILRPKCGQGGGSWTKNIHLLIVP